MPIMLATYSTNKIIVLKRYVSERRKIKININQTNTHTYKQSNKEMLEEENTGLIN